MFYTIQTVYDARNTTGDEYETIEAAREAAIKIAGYAPGTFTVVEAVARVTNQPTITDISVKR